MTSIARVLARTLLWGLALAATALLAAAAFAQSTYIFGVRGAASGDTTVPSTISLSVSNPTNSSCDLSFVAPYDDGPSSGGLCASYDCRVCADGTCSGTITTSAPDEWSGASACSGTITSTCLLSGEPTPFGTAGTTVQSFTATGLTPATTYDFACRALDEVPLTSVISNTATCTTTNIATGDILHEDFAGGTTCGSYTCDNGWSVDDSGCPTNNGSGCIATGDSTAISSSGFSGQHWRGVLTEPSGSDWEVSIGTRATVYARFYIRVEAFTMTGSDAYKIFALNGTSGWSGDVNPEIKLKASGTDMKLNLVSNAGAVDELWPSVGGLSTGTDYYVEVKAINNGTTDTLEWKVNGTIVATHTAGSFISEDMTTVMIGARYTFAKTVTFDIDTLDLSTSGYLGP